MTRFISTTLALLFLISAAGAASAQEAHTRTMTLSPDEASILPGIGALVLLKDSALVVDMVPDPDQRPDKFREVDLKKGDVILMANGHRVKTAGELNEAIEAVEIGDPVKLGIKRDNAMLITSFERVDAPGRQVVMTTTMGEPGTAGSQRKVVRMGGPEGEDGTVLVLDGGLIIGRGTSGPEPVVVALLPDAADKIEGEMPQEGDEIVSINGNLDTNISAFEEWYNSVPDGEKVNVVFKRDGKELKCSYTKAELKHGSMMIKK